MMNGGAGPSEFGSSADSGSNFIRNESEEEKFFFKPQINQKSREMVELAQMKNIAE